MAIDERENSQISEAKIVEQQSQQEALYGFSSPTSYTLGSSPLYRRSARSFISDQSSLLSFSATSQFNAMSFNTSSSRLRGSAPPPPSSPGSTGFGFAPPPSSSSSMGFGFGALFGGSGSAKQKAASSSRSSMKSASLSRKSNVVNTYDESLVLSGPVPKIGSIENERLPFSEKKQGKNIEVLLQFLSFQSFDGKFLADEEFYKYFDDDDGGDNSLRKSNPDETIKEEIWATSIAIKYLEIVLLPNFKEESEMCFEKATKSLKKLVTENGDGCKGNDSKEKVEWVLEKAGEWVTKWVNESS